MLTRKLSYYPGGVAEWLKAPVLKTGSVADRRRTKRLQRQEFPTIGVVTGQARLRCACATTLGWLSS